MISRYAAGNLGLLVVRAGAYAVRPTQSERPGKTACCNKSDFIVLQGAFGMCRYSERCGPQVVAPLHLLRRLYTLSLLALAGVKANAAAFGAGWRKSVVEVRRQASWLLAGCLW